MSKINHEKLNKNKLVKSSVARRNKPKVKPATVKQKELMNKLGIEYTKYTTKYTALNLIKDKLSKKSVYKEINDQDEL